MKRRTFIKKNAIVTLAPFITTGLLARNKKIKSLSEKPFQLNYAPHFGMFESMAGKDLMDQIQFMHDQGFRSLEDNGMKNRSKKTQNDIAKKMEKLGMSMGVFVGIRFTGKSLTWPAGIDRYKMNLLKILEIR